MTKTYFFSYLLWVVVVWCIVGCSAQKVQPTAPVYNITITQTDNSQTITGEHIKAEAISKTQTKAVADIKPDVKAEADQTTKNGMWIFWLVVLGLVIAGGAFVWYKLRKQPAIDIYQN